jgi:hypothetical protein
MMKKTLTEAQFAEVIRTLNIEQQTVMIARGVLVEGKRQKYFVSELGLTPGAISQAVKRVWEAFQEKAAVPPGHERVTVILPAHQAFIAKKWEHQAQSARKPGI